MRLYRNRKFNSKSLRFGSGEVLWAMNIKRYTRYVRNLMDSPTPRSPIVTPSKKIHDRSTRRDQRRKSH